jgi:hypothetical protein
LNYNRKGFQEGIYEIENTPDIAVLVDDAAADVGHGNIYNLDQIS